MPPPRSPTPPLDPFPPLPLRRRPRSSSSLYQSYALAARQSSSSARSGGAMVGSEDVDRSDPLDELNMYASASSSRNRPASGPSDAGEEAAGGEPPWRVISRPRRRIRRIDGGTGPESDPAAADTEGETGRDGTINGGQLAPIFALDDLLSLPRPIPGSTASTVPSAAINAPSTTSSAIPVRRRAPVTRRPLTEAPSHPSDRPRSPSSSSGSSADSDADEELFPFSSERTRALFTQDNLTAADLSLSSLRRGGENRRRRNTLGERDARRRAEDWGEMLRLGAPGPADDERRTGGLSPTNLRDRMEGWEMPLMVRSAGGLRRARSASPDSDGRPAAKRRKLATSFRRDPKFQRKSTTTSPPRPSYLRYTTLPHCTPLPTSFPAPHTVPMARLLLTTLPPSATFPHPRPLLTYPPSPPPTHTDDDASAMYTAQPIPAGLAIHYYEVEVLSSGEEGLMSIGWMREGCSLNRLVGWDQGSWGWHGDDGRGFEGRGWGSAFGPGWGKGDFVGAGIDYTTGRAFFTKNGKLIGHTFKDLPRLLHPAVGLKTPNESLAINFTGPFEFDIDDYVKSASDAVWKGIEDRAATSVPWIARSKVYGLQSASSDKSAKHEARDKGLRSPAEEYDRVDVKVESAVKLEAEVEPAPSGDAVQTTVDLVPAELCNDSKPTAPALTTANTVQTPEESASAALVLDHIRHFGLDTAHALLRRDMVKRGWVTSTCVPITAGSSLSPTPTEPTIDSRLRTLHSSILASRQEPVPWQDIYALDPSRLSVSGNNAPLGRRLRMLDFERLVKAGTVDEAVEVGRELIRDERVSAWQWGADEIRERTRVFGLLAGGGEEGREASQETEAEGREKRLELAEQLVYNIRRSLGLPVRSLLSAAVSQTSELLALLRERYGEAGLVDVRRVWGTWPRDDHEVPGEGTEGGKVDGRAKLPRGGGMGTGRDASKGLAGHDEEGAAEAERKRRAEVRFVCDGV